ncbi:MAG: YitT family protein [Lachnospiraceae bacterium]
MGKKWKETGIDLLVDVIGGMLIAVGIYNFAVKAAFPMTGFSGIALIFYHLFKLPIGTMTMVLNIPVVILCYRLLGRKFFLVSLKTMIISSILMDVVAPMLPVYTGNRMLAAICTGVLSGLGYAIIYMRNSSTGGADFIIMALKALKPHMSIGQIAFGIDFVIILLGGVIYKEVDGVIYGLIVTFILSAVVDKVMYGIDAGKMTLIVTQHGEEVAGMIDEYSGRGSTLLRGVGSYSKEEKQVVMCACNNKQMYAIRKNVKEIDPNAFTVIMESNEVVGEGFKDK